MEETESRLRWPDKEIVTDPSQGVQLATMQKLARYWETEYDWRKCEAKLNSLSQFITEIDGLDISRFQRFLKMGALTANCMWPIAESIPKLLND